MSPVASGHEPLYVLLYFKFKLYYANLPIPESLASKSTRIGILGNEFLLILNGFFIFIFKVSFTGSENFFFFLDGELDKDVAPLFDE